MPNQRHLAMLKQGVNVWNRWRWENPEIIPELIAADLRGYVLVGVDLSGVDLSRANLHQVDLSGANLSQAELIRVNLSHAVLCGANLSKVNLSESDLTGCNLTQALLGKTNLTKVNFSYANLSGAILNSALFSGAILNNTNLCGANLSCAIFSKTTFKDINLHTADLSGTNLSGINLSGVNLVGANLSSANLSDTNLSMVDLRGANLNNANLSKAKLNVANLSGTSLVLANLHRCELRGANLVQANLTAVGGTEVELRGANLQAAILHQVNFTGGLLFGADLQDADITEANFRFVNLGEANLTRVRADGTNFSNAILSGACLEGWHINNLTQFTDVICSHVYLKRGLQKRYPQEGENFTQGEFVLPSQVQYKEEFTSSIIKLIFNAGIDWEALLTSLERLMEESKVSLAIRAIENNEDTLIVHLNLPVDANRNAIEEFLWNEYGKILETQIEENYRQNSANLLDTLKLLVSQQEMSVLPSLAEMSLVLKQSQEKSELKTDYSLLTPLSGTVEIAKINLDINSGELGFFGKTLPLPSPNQVKIAANTIESHLESPKKEIQLSTYQFETLTVDGKGNIVNRFNTNTEYWVEELGGDIILEMVQILGDKFIMGSPKDEPKRRNNEGPLHEVEIPTFLIGKYPITQAQYQAIMGNNPSQFQGNNRPVEKVSWHNAIEFCKQLSQKTGRSYRLPSEAEWEYACRAGTTTQYYFGDSITTKLVNFNQEFNYSSSSKGQPNTQTKPVGSYPPNLFGLYDMHGQVWEWCQDHYHSNYYNAPNNGIAWLTGGDDTLRILRGGSWYTEQRYCRSANRISENPNYRTNDIGFRIVLDTETTY